MLFKSRQTATLSQRLRLAVWPRVSWSRSIRYAAKRIVRVKASPHKIAIGFAAGVFASITPLVGIQMAMAAAITFILRGSMIAAMLATLMSNPVSWPLIWGATYGLGALMIGHPGAAEAAAAIHSNDPVLPVLIMMLVGSIPIGLVSAAVSYGLVARALTAAQQQRATKFGAIQTRLYAWVRDRMRPDWRLW